MMIMREMDMLLMVMCAKMTAVGMVVVTRMTTVVMVVVALGEMMRWVWVRLSGWRT
ncbi:MAG: hypothetical protein JW384_00103 [Nitrosomonadaceae bacterium]|nr:hypothetical protein [Nitrosomonadaceae bacterium]